ncbi:MAG: PEP-utilizing enzyme, partial [Candidatus Magasanikbacteria bacterium]|nr:PEP-utilizing enzyme [Candidatus Magasanikbacteria bacterium]
NHTINHAQHINNDHLFFSTIWLNGFVSFFEKNTGKAYNKILCKYEGYHLWFYFGEKDSYEVAEHLVNRKINEEGFAHAVNENIIIEADKLTNFSAKIPQTNLDKLFNEDLWNIYRDHHATHSHYYTWAWIPVAADMFHNNLTKRVKDYLHEKGVLVEKINEYLVNLTQPTKKSLIFIEQEDLLKIAIAIEEDRNLVNLFETQDAETIKNNLPSNISNLLQEHKDKYYHTKHLWVSGEYTINDYINQLKDVFKTKQSPKIILDNQFLELEKAQQKRSKLLQDLNVDSKWKKIFDEFGDFMVTKIYRRYAQLLAVHHMAPILKEIARRFFITEKQVRFMTVSEIKDMLINDKYDEAELLERTKFCVYYAERDAEKIFVGDEAREIMKSIEKEVDINISELKGESGCVGYAKGKVKIIIRAEDMNKMEEGDILVSIATDPDIVPAMKKAAGIITEQGGVTSHAAIVSRELGIPCVIGTKIATKVFKDGDMVEVDANNGVVRKI